MENNSQETKRSNFLTALCFISLIVSVGFIGGSVYGLKNLEATIGQMETAQMGAFQLLSDGKTVEAKDLPGHELLEAIGQRGRISCYSLIVLSFISMIGVFLLFRKRKIGFYVFSLGNIIIAAGMFYAYLFLEIPAEYKIYFLSSGMISFLLIALFSFHLKNLR